MARRLQTALGLTAFMVALYLSACGDKSSCVNGDDGSDSDSDPGSTSSSPQ